DEVDVEVLSGNESGNEDDEVLVRVTARERISARPRAAAAPARPSAPPPLPVAVTPPPVPAAPAPPPPPALAPAEAYEDYTLEEQGEQTLATPADAVAPIATEILQKLLTQMRFRARILRHETENEDFLTSGSDAPSLVLNIVGVSEQDKSLLIGRRGET